MQCTHTTHLEKVLSTSSLTNLNQQSLTGTYHHYRQNTATVLLASCHQALMQECICHNT